MEDASLVMFAVPSDLVVGSLVQNKSGWSRIPTHWQNDRRVRQRRDLRHLEALLLRGT